MIRRRAARAPLAGPRGRGAGVAWLIVVAIVASTGAAEARPKRRDAKAAFDRGLAAYKKGKFAAASAALSKAFALERDADTVFAWAQAERKLEHCDKALELYDTVLGFELPARNREAVERSIADCRAVIAALQPAVPPVAEPAPPAPAIEPEVAPAPAAPARAAPPAPSAPPASAWYRGPVTLALLGTGGVASGVGVGLLLSAHALDRESHHAATIDDARALGQQARSRGNLGLVTTGVGAALVIGGVVWIVLRREPSEQPAVTGWLAPRGGGGLAVTGAF